MLLCITVVFFFIAEISLDLYTTLYLITCDGHWSFPVSGYYKAAINICV